MLTFTEKYDILITDKMKKGNKRMKYAIKMRLKELLDERGITQKELSEKTGIRQSTISEICRNSKTVMNFKHIVKIAEVLEIQDIREIIDLNIED